MKPDSMKLSSLYPRKKLMSTSPSTIFYTDSYILFFYILPGYMCGYMKNVLQFQHKLYYPRNI